MRYVFLAAALVLVLSTASAATTEVNPEPGLMTAGSPLYSLDVGFDRVMMLTPWSNPGEVAMERASEMKVAEQRNNSLAFERAANGLNRTVERADERHRESLQQAVRVLKSVQEQVPEQAGQGLETALQKVRRAQNRTVSQGFLSGNGSTGVPSAGDSSVPGGVPDIDPPGGR